MKMSSLEENYIYMFMSVCLLQLGILNHIKLIDKLKEKYIYIFQYTVSEYVFLFYP